jgi:hypothetical protein
MKPSTVDSDFGYITANAQQKCTPEKICGFQADQKVTF